MNLRFFNFALDDLSSNTEMRKADFSMSTKAKKTSYPVRGFRYWWLAHEIESMAASREVSVIVDMGAGDGQMLRYCRGASITSNLGSKLTWVGLDKNTSNLLRDSGYDRIIQADFDRPLPIESNSVDLLVSIHVMEHLPRPEFTMAEISRVLAPGGIFCGGSPTAPEPLSSILHQWLQYKMKQGTTNSNGHINSLSPSAWKKLTHECGLVLDYMSGSHFMRLSGSPLEDSKWWARANLFWGGCFPSLGSEIYLRARKPVT